MFFMIFVTTMWHHNHFKSAFCSLVHAISTELRAWRIFSFFEERILCSFAWCCHTRLTSLSKMTSSPSKWLFFTLFSGNKVTWVRVTLIEGCLKAAIFLYSFLIKITYQHLMKRLIFLVCFYYLFVTADLRRYRGYFLTICKLCLSYHYPLRQWLKITSNRVCLLLNEVVAIILVLWASMQFLPDGFFRLTLNFSS